MTMSVDAKKSMGGMMILILLGVVAFVGGVKWLGVLIPAAAMIWYGAGTMVGSGRN